jgi:hypothetical protein
MIRFAAQSDMDEIVAASRQFYDEIRLDDVGYAFHEECIRDSYQLAIDQDGHYVLLYIEDCRILGLFFYSVRDEQYYFKNRRFSAEIVWHSLPTLPPKKRLKVMMKLLEAGEMHIKSIGAEHLYIGIDARPEFKKEGIARYLTTRGFSNIVATYHK